MNASLDLTPAGLSHATVLAGMHAVCFAEPWSVRSMAEVLMLPGAHGLIAVDGTSLRPSLAPPGPAGLVLWRCLGDEAEILTLAVLPPWRRRGVGARLLTAALVDSAGRGAEAMFLEVADDNPAAQALYRGLGFISVGRRKGYYRGIDAMTMRCSLNSFKSSLEQEQKSSYIS